ncbi:MAG: hypothetical protein KAU06_04745 [Candidatus Marinimicrobia bacterium]|nr:hypothetical protein [Candidatus Neomarinimicrobiota bacterium]
MKRFRMWWNMNELWLGIGLMVLVFIFAFGWLFVSREEVKYWYEMRTFEQQVEGIEMALWVLIFIHLIKSK